MDYGKQLAAQNIVCMKIFINWNPIFMWITQLQKKEKESFGVISDQKGCKTAKKNNKI